MTMNPLVEKIYQSTVQKSLDLEILNELDFQPEKGCELTHQDGKGIICSGEATHWQEWCQGSPQKVCENTVAWVEEHAHMRCQGCSAFGRPKRVSECWHYVPIVK